jgi:hypothetical protein
MEAVTSPTDPILAKRARMAVLVKWGMRAGYGFLSLAVVAFLVGWVRGFSGVTTRLVAFGMLLCTLTLAPSIVFAYGIKAAEREDREQGR